MFKPRLQSRPALLPRGPTLYCANPWKRNRWVLGRLEVSGSESANPLEAVTAQSPELHRLQNRKLYRAASLYRELKPRSSFASRAETAQRFSVSLGEAHLLHTLEKDDCTVIQIGVRIETVAGEVIK